MHLEQLGCRNTQHTDAGIREHLEGHKGACVYHDILSLYNTGATATAVLSGTSMSTPFVTGSLALLKAQFPSDTYRQLINRLLSAVDTNANLLGKAQTGGRLNLARALASSANRPFNDNFAGRAHLAGTSVTVRSNNAGATREGAEPVIGGSSGGASLWWDWTAPATGAVTATTAGSAYATLLGVYTGTSLGTLSPVAASAASGAGASNVTFTAQAGTTYAIAVDGQNAATGLTALNLHYTNTAFASAITLSGASTAITGTTFASASPASLSHLSDYLVWFSWTAPKSAQFQVSASSYDFDPRLTVYTGSSASALTQVARSTAATIGANASTASTACLCTFWATAGTTYTFTVDGVGDANSLSGALDSSGLPVGGGQFALSTLDSRWQAITDDSITCSPAVGKDGTVYAGSVSGTFYAYNPDGTKKWSYASPTSGSFDTSSAAISSDGAAVYAGCGDQNLYALSTSTGSVLWAHTFGAAPACSPAVASDGTIYIRDSGGTFSALNPATGAAKWTFSIPGASYGAPVVASDGTIYIGSDNGSLYAITPAGTGATQKWTFAANQTIANDAIYTAPRDRCRRQPLFWDPRGHGLRGHLSWGKALVLPDRKQHQFVPCPGIVRNGLCRQLRPQALRPEHGHRGPEVGIRDRGRDPRELSPGGGGPERLRGRPGRHLR